MNAALATLRWHPMAVTHLACVQGCLDYLNIPIAPSWLFGCTGHAFLMHLDEKISLSGPTTWDWLSDWMRLGQNLGYRTTTVFGNSSETDYAAKRQQAWNFVKDALDVGSPCYGWDMDYPEFYAIYGYEEPGQVDISGPMPDDCGRRSWENVGGRTGVICVNRVEPVPPADDATAVRAGLRYTLDFAEGKSVAPNHASGIRAYEWWIRALNDESADITGSGYNAMVWHECRNVARRFLREARGRFDGALSDLFAEATAQYDAVTAALSTVEALLPFPPNRERPPDVDIRRMAVEHLEIAKASETTGLATLARIVECL